MRRLHEAGTYGMGAWELFYGAILHPWLQGRLFLHIPCERRCLAAAPGQQPGLLGGVGFEPHLISHQGAWVVGLSCPVNFSPSVTNLSPALCGQLRHPAPSSESCRDVFYNPSLWSPVIAWKYVLLFLCAEPAYPIHAGCRKDLENVLFKA